MNQNMDGTPHAFELAEANNPIATEPAPIKIKAKFERRGFPFWSCPNPETEGATFKDRGGRSHSLVGVYNPGRNDKRLKIWLDEPNASSVFEINGYKFLVPHVRDGFHQGHVNGTDLHNLLRGVAIEDVNLFGENARQLHLPNDDFQDFCVETRFEEGGKYGALVGSVEAWPEWLKAESISITPPRTSGGWHCITFDTGHTDRRFPGKLPWLRVNGIWCYASPTSEPVGNQYDFRGKFLLLCDPDDMNIIRSYGKDIAGDITLENEPLIPRDRNWMRLIHRILDAGLSREEWLGWNDDLKKLRNAIRGMCQAQGQADFYTSAIEGNRSRAAHYERAVQRRLKYTEGVKDRHVRSYEHKANVAREYEQKNTLRLEDYNKYVDKHREAHEAALAACEAREAKYAAEIADIRNEFDLY